MGEVEQFDRSDLGVAETARSGLGRKDSVPHEPLGPQPVREPIPATPVSRPLGSPLPTGTRLPGSEGRPASHPPGRALSTTPHTDAEPTSAVQWAASVLRQAVPFVQKLLPLLDGNIATAVASVMSARPPAAAPAPRVDLQPLENGLTELHTQQRDLRNQVLEQNASLKRVEDQLEMVREATDRNTLEQQELIEDLKAMGNKVNLFAVLLLVLLVISVLLNLFLFLHIQRVLP